MEKNVNKMLEYPKEGIISKTLVKNDKIEIGLYCMTAGTEMSEHTSTKAGFVHILDGKGVFRIEGENIKMFPGVFFFMKENSVHSLRADENTSFILGLL